MPYEVLPKKGAPMSTEVVKEYLKEYALQDRVIEFETSSATVKLAAIAIGCKPERIAKSISFLVDEKVVLIVSAGDSHNILELSLEEFEKTTHYIEWIDVCKNWA